MALGGLLDWLTEGTGGGFTGSGMPNLNPMGDAAGGGMPYPTPAPAPTMPMPPPQMTGQDAYPIGGDPMAGMGSPPADPMIAGGAPPNGPGLPLPPGGDPMTAGGTAFPPGADPMVAGGPPGNGPGLPAPPVPLPAPRPQVALPPNAAPTAGGPLPPMMAPQAAPPIAPAGGGGDSNSMLGRALGLSPNADKTVFGGLAAGLKAAGNSAGKSPFQALASGAGEAMEGSQKSGDKVYDQKIKYLQAAIAAQAAGDKAEYNKNYALYLGAKLKNDTDAAVGKTGKTGAWNKPDSQKFIDATNAANKDRDVIASQKMLEQLSKTGGADEIAKATAAHSALVDQKQKLYLTGVGLDPQKIVDNVKNPPGTQANPHQVTTQKDFDTYVKPGQAYRNPRDGKVYIRKGGEAKGGGESAAPAAPKAPSAPAPPGPMPRTMSSAAAASDDDDE